MKDSEPQASHLCERYPDRVSDISLVPPNNPAIVLQNNATQSLTFKGRFSGPTLSQWARLDIDS